MSKSPADDSARAFGSRVRVAREASGLSQSALGSRANVSAKFISQIEHGHVNPSVGVAERLAHALGIAPIFAPPALAPVPPVLIIIRTATGREVCVSSIDADTAEDVNSLTRLISDADRLTLRALLAGITAAAHHGSK